jgi:L-alanine-DL-glutamate epimerase-like enolase superfamily enzyme
MKVVSLRLHALRIPFRVSFKHASAERRVTQSVLVVARSAEGMSGYGEGCPREYVTGETDVSVFAFFEQHREDIQGQVTDLGSLQEWSRNHAHAIDQNPAAWCAIEMALLDLLARHNGQPVEALLGLPALEGPFAYSAVLGAMGANQFAQTLARYQQIGMRDFKIKLSGNLELDRANTAVLRAAGIAAERVRADANNLWDDVEVSRRYLESLDYPFAAIEEPLRPGQFAALAALAESLGTRIVLDESLTRADQLAQLPAGLDQWIVNLRVSKMGGLLRSLDVARRCAHAGIALIVGAQVGETSLLTRAALVAAQVARHSVIAHEGAYGTWLLEADAVQPTLMFGARGELDPLTLGLAQLSGLGLAPIPDLAERYFGRATDTDAGGR